VEGSPRSGEAYQENVKSAVMVHGKGIAKTKRIAYQDWFGRKRGESVYWKFRNLQPAGNTQFYST